MDVTQSVRDAARTWFEQNWDPDLSLGEWWERLADSGWGLPTWPRDRWGRGLGQDQAAIVHEERRNVGAYGPPSGIGVMMAGPTILAHGTREQQDSFLPDMVTGRAVWCQLFSEPGSGSDLASLQTRAVRDGDEWVVNGQKVWTSGAQFSRWGILIARTDLDAPKHRGITFFVIDMDQPGVDVRPLREMTGGETFNEVFFTDARVPHANIIGRENDGWAVAVTTLAHERNSLAPGAGGGGEIVGRPDLSRRVGDLGRAAQGGEQSGIGAALGGGGATLVRTLAEQFGRSGDPVFRQDLARVHTLAEIARYTMLRVKAESQAGRQPGPSVSTGKLLASHIVRSLRELALRIEGAHGMLVGGDAPLGGAAQALALFSPAVSIAGGSDEIQHNIIGERVLGLPGEPRVDKDVPFRELRVGTQR
jgi:alkylation response protein AidB-like acyl-CoA dehydrogenase